jgi:hypothetical protein
MMVRAPPWSRQPSPQPCRPSGVRHRRSSLTAGPDHGTPSWCGCCRRCRQGPRDRSCTFFPGTAAFREGRMDERHNPCARAVPVAQPVVVALLEDPQGRHRASVLGAPGGGLRRHRSPQTPLSCGMPHDNAGHSQEGQPLPEVAKRSGNRYRQGFSLPFKLRYRTLFADEVVLHRLKTCGHSGSHPASRHILRQGSDPGCCRSVLSPCAPSQPIIFACFGGRNT